MRLTTLNTESMGIMFLVQLIIRSSLMCQGHSNILVECKTINQEHKRVLAITQTPFLPLRILNKTKTPWALEFLLELKVHRRLLKEVQLNPPVLLQDQQLLELQQARNFTMLTTSAIIIPLLRQVQELHLLNAIQCRVKLYLASKIFHLIIRLLLITNLQELLQQNKMLISLQQQCL